MPDLRFDTAYTFSATGGSANRTMAARLNDVINVKDWGAKGDGATDDTDAIQAAINYAMALGGFQRGGIVFIPAGTYIISKGGTTPLLFGPSDDTGACLVVIGASRNATILKGNYNGFLVKKTSHIAPQIQNVEHMTIWNQSTYGGGGALFCASLNDTMSRFKNLRLKGFCGLELVHDIYNMSIDNCIFEAPGPALGEVAFQRADAIGERTISNMSWSGGRTLVTTAQPHNFPTTVDTETLLSVRLKANPAAFTPNGFGNEDVRIRPLTDTTFDFAAPNPGVAFVSGSWYRPSGPLPLSVGVYSAQGYIHSCRAVGFDIGYAINGVCQAVIGCSAERCNVGIQFGQLPPHKLNEGSNGSVLGNVITRCKRGIYMRAGAEGVVAGNVIRDDPDAPIYGVCDPAPISNMAWSGVTNKVTVTTSVPHNIPLGEFGLQLLGINPSAFTPNGTGTQNVLGESLTATTFRYTLNSNPGSFVSGSWNFPLEWGLLVRTVSITSYKANHIPVSAYYAGVDLTELGNVGTQVGNVMMAMRPAAPWLMTEDVSSISGVNGDWVQGAAWEFIQCGGTGTVTDTFLPGRRRPTPYNRVGALMFSGYPTLEYNIVNGTDGAGFGDTVIGNGSGHYKVRFDGTNWMRVG
jgi:parallel beta-helix repeat protein